MFRSPLDIPITLAGTFGEVRGSHFHAGIDIRTNGKEGLSVYAVEEGYVSRIKISKTAYGKALYIEHPNGYTTVYAHLQKFSDKIERQIRAIQYSKESFEVDEYFLPGTIAVEKSELIGISGNSGRSMAPHLHFEVRESKTEQPLNPLAFLVAIEDNTPPLMNDLFIYKMDDSRARLFPLRERIIKRTEAHTLSKDTLTLGFQKVGFGINTYDTNGSGGHNGIYELTATMDGKPFYRFAMNRISFDETRYSLAHVDYRLNEATKIKAHRIYKLPGNYFNFYDALLNNGLLTLDSVAVSKVSISTKDFYGNASTLDFFIRYDKSALFPDFSSLEYDTIFDFRIDNVFQNDEVNVFLPKKTCYDSIFFNYKKVSGMVAGRTYSSVHQIHTESEPAHLSFNLSIKPIGLPENLKDKALIVRDTKNPDEPEPKESSWEGEYLKTRTRDFGKYYITVDTVPPKILAVNIYDNKVVTTQQTLQFKISDNLSGIKTYRGTVDGKWILMEYDEKNDLLTYFFDEHVEPGEHNFVLQVSDMVGNQAKYQVKFKR